MLFLYIVLAVYIIQIFYVRKYAPDGDFVRIRSFLRKSNIFNSAVLLCGGILFLLSDYWGFGVFLMVLFLFSLLNIKRPELTMRFGILTRGSFKNYPTEQLTVITSTHDELIETTTQDTSSIISRLEKNGFEINKDVYYRGQTFKYIAKRKYPNSISVGHQHLYLCFAEFSSLDIPVLRQFSNNAYKYIRNPFRNPSIFTGGSRCIPGAILPEVTPELTAAITNEKIKTHFLVFTVIQVMPVICVPSTGQIHYSKHIPWSGHLFIQPLWDLITQLLVPSNSGNESKEEEENV